MKRKELTDKLTLVGNALAKDNLVPIFQCFDFDGERVTAYNDELAISVPCQTSSSFIVNGNILIGLLNNSRAEDIELGLDQGSLVVKAGRSTLKLPCALRDDWVFEEPKMGKEEILLPINENLIAGLKACLLTSSTDNAQPAFMGICLVTGPKSKSLYSTNGDAISRYVLDGEPKKTKTNYRILPNSFCDALIKIMAETDAIKGAIMIYNEWAVAVIDSEYVIHGRLLHVDNPLDYEKELGKTRPDGGTAVPVPKGLEHALSRARVLADIESASTMMTVQENRLKLLTETHLGVVRDSIQFKHPDVKANVSAQLIQRCIGLCDKMYVRENCVEFWGGDQLYILTSNMGD